MKKVQPTKGRRRMSSDRRRSQLLRSAIESFARRGFAGTKTRDIASAAGVSEAILFRHFATKEHLYRAILDAKENQKKDSSAERRRTLEDCARRRDDAAVLRHLATQILSSFREDPAFHRLMVYASLEGHLMAHLFRERFAQPMGGFLRGYVTARQREGAFRECDPEIATTFILATIVHWAMSKYVFGMKRSRLSEDAVVEQLAELVLGGLKADGKVNQTNERSCPAAAGNPS
jgi:AcrR family transcriptional regulator